MGLDAYRLKQMPFAPVSPERAASLWADRKATASQIDAVLADWSYGRASTINLLWADLGAGKTHTLYHIQARCRSNGRLLPIYVLLPATIRKFLELYGAIADVLDWAALAPKIDKKQSTRTGRNLVRALEWIANPVDARHLALAERWVHAERLTLAQCAEIGITRTVDDTESAVE